MKLSDLWPGHKPHARTAAKSVVSVAVTKRAGVEQPIATGNTPEPPAGPRGPTAMPATLAECEALEERLCRDAIRLECQIGIAEGAAKAERRYADPVWYHRAKAALKHINRDRQLLSRHMKALRVESRLRDQQAEGQLILDVIKEALPPEQFKGFVQIAEARAGRGAEQ